MFSLAFVKLRSLNLIESLFNAIKQELSLDEDLDDEEMLMGMWITEENLASLIHVEIEERENKIKELIGEGSEHG